MYRYRCGYWYIREFKNLSSNAFKDKNALNGLAIIHVRNGSKIPSRCESTSVAIRQKTQVVCYRLVT